MADMFEPSQRGTAMSLFTLATFAGQVSGFENTLVDASPLEGSLSAGLDRY